MYAAYASSSLVFLISSILTNLSGSIDPSISTGASAIAAPALGVAVADAPRRAFDGAKPTGEGLASTPGLSRRPLAESMSNRRTERVAVLDSAEGVLATPSWSCRAESNRAESQSRSARRPRDPAAVFASTGVTAASGTSCGMRCVDKGAWVSKGQLIIWRGVDAAEARVTRRGGRRSLAMLE